MEKLSRYLLVDVGNSRMKWASAGPRGEIRPAGELATAEATPEQIHALANEFPDHIAIVVSVVPKWYAPFGEAFSRRAVYVTAALPALGLRFNYPGPREIGADRLAAAVAVSEDGPGPAIIVQCGTATAYTVLDTENRVCGGAISPGLEAQLAVLNNTTALLPKIDMHSPETFLARSTVEAIRSGVLLNFRGGVKETVRSLAHELGASQTPRVVLTGGNVHWLEGALDFPHTIRPLLVFEGLRIIGTSSFREPLLYLDEPTD
jgi:type III pantothenate kinase